MQGEDKGRGAVSAIWRGSKTFASWATTGLIPLAIIAGASFSAGRASGFRDGTREMRGAVMCLLESTAEQPNQWCDEASRERRRAIAPRRQQPAPPSPVSDSEE